MISSLDGPKGAAYQEEHPDQGHPSIHQQQQQQHQLEPGQPPEMWATKLEWRGYPCFAEPGIYVPDRTHQRESAPVLVSQIEDQNEKPVGH